MPVTSPRARERAGRDSPRPQCCCRSYWSLTSLPGEALFARRAKRTRDRGLSAVGEGRTAVATRLSGPGTQRSAAGIEWSGAAIPG